MGVTFDQKAGIYRVVYDKDRMIERLMIRDDLSLDESTECLEYNVWNAYAGKGTPLYVDVMPDRKDIEDSLTNYNE